MAFTPIYEKIENILNDKVVYTIPRYQRKYVWTKENIIQLIDDINYYSKEVENDEHFIGSLILTTENKDEYKIIDGQQRMTTLEICIFVLIYMNAKEYINIKDNSIKNNIKYLQDFISTKKGSEGVKQKLEVENKLYNDLCEYCIIMLETTDSETTDAKIKENLEAIEEIVEKGLKEKNEYVIAFKTIHEYLTQTPSEETYRYICDFQTKFLNTKIIKMACFKEEKAYSIFEILNARGVQLKQIELLKNLVLRKCREGQTQDLTKNKWIKMETMLGDIDADVFLMHFVRSYYGVSTKKAEVYAYIKKTEEKNNLKKFFKDLIEYADLYNKIVNINTANTKERRVYTYFKIKNNQQIRSLLVSLKKKEKDGIINNAKHTELLYEILKYFIGFNFISNYSNKIDSKIIRASNKIYNASNSHEVENEIYRLLLNIYDYYPTKEELSEKIAEIKYSNKNKKGNINSELLLFLFDFILNVSEKHEEYNIDHIILDSKENGIVWKLGNLIPTPVSFNTKLGSSNIQEKLEKYKNSGIRHLQEFSKGRTNFEDDDIKNRTNSLVKLMIKTFFLEKQSLEQEQRKSQTIINVIEIYEDTPDLRQTIITASKEAIFNNLDNTNVLEGKINEEIKKIYQKSEEDNSLIKAEIAIGINDKRR